MNTGKTPILVLTCVLFRVKVLRTNITSSISTRCGRMWYGISDEGSMADSIANCE